MKFLFIAAIAALSLSNAQAQAPAPGANLRVQAPQSSDSRLADMAATLVALEAKVTSLQAENVAQKEQINNLKTSAKVIDMVLTDLRTEYKNHVHVTGNYRISGFYAQKLSPTGMPLKFLTTQQAESAPQYSSKPEAAK